MDQRVSRLRRGLWSSVLGCGLAAVMVIAGCGTSGESDNPAQVLPAPTGGPGVGQPEAQTNCTKRATNAGEMAQEVSGAAAGDRICLSGDMGSARLDIKRSGSPDKPIVFLGGGRTTTAGITITSDNVVIDGVAVQKPKAPGISITGKNITVQNSAVVSPRGGDGDGIRFWGQNIKILHNTISDTRGQDEKHADCMQTFATDDEHRASQNILIDGNRCEKIDNICLIAEGPNSEAGDGSGDGKSTNFTFSNNYCDNRADQATFIDDISNVTITNNQIDSKIVKAFSFQNNAIGAKVNGNKISPEIKYEVGMDDSSEDSYQGPKPGGGP